MINLTCYNNVTIFGDPPKLRFHIGNNNEIINIFITKDEEQCITTERVCGLAQSSDGYERKTSVYKIVGDTRQLADIKLEYNDMQSGKQI